MLSCRSEYDQYVHREINKDVRYDSLIFDMYIGETQKDFFSKCWQLNRDSLISQGSTNMKAKYIEPVVDSSDMLYRKQMEFYGIFDKDKVMQGMDMVYSHTGWAPWNKPLHADSLILRLKDEIIQDYGGNEFIGIELPELDKKAYVKIDGNRQILLYPVNTKDVAVKIEDLNFKMNEG